MSARPFAPSQGSADEDRPRSETFDRIVESAVAVFSDVGYHGASVRSIAEHAGLRASSMYNHFTTKEAILWEIVRRAMWQLNSGVEDAIKGAEDPVLRVIRFVIFHTQFHIYEARAASVVNNLLGAVDPDRYAEQIRERDRYEQWLRRAVTDGIEVGTFRPTDSALTVFAVLEQGVGIPLWYRPSGRLSVHEISLIYPELAMRMLGAGTDDFRQMIAEEVSSYTWPFPIYASTTSDLDAKLT
jgi:AcrR family transcriptional regulator